MKIIKEYNDDITPVIIGKKEELTFDQKNILFDIILKRFKYFMKFKIIFIKKIKLSIINVSNDVITCGVYYMYYNHRKFYNDLFLDRIDINDKELISKIRKKKLKNICSR